MRIRPALLFWGLFLILLGGLPLLVRSGVLDPDVLADAWRLWPLLLVALGLSMILGRTRAGLLGTAIAAIVIGVAAGGALASGTTWMGNVGGCGAADPGDGPRFADGGTVDQPISATFDLDCGAIDLSMAPGSEWRVDADYRGEPPTLELSDGRVGLRSPSGLGIRGQHWTVTLPVDLTRSIELQTNAGSSNVRLAGANLAEFKVELNAGDVRVDASGGRIEELDLSTNAGRIRLRVDEGVSGSMSANAGSIEVCAPEDATLRLRVEEQLTLAHNLDDRGLARSGDIWTREGALGAPVVDLSVEGNAANFTLDPEGGC